MLSIIIPVYITEEPEHIINTLQGIKRTIGLNNNDYTISLIGSINKNIFLYKNKTNNLPNWNFIPTSAKAGEARNIGANYAILNFNTDIIVFMDAHINFFEKESKNWGVILTNFLSQKPTTIAGPAISLYDNPEARGYGVISTITDENISNDMAWKWVGTPNINNEPFIVPALCVCFVAMTTSTFKNSVIGFTGPLGIEGRDFLLRMWLLGHDIYSISELTIGHKFSTGYTDFTKERSIDWGESMLLYVYLNMNDEITMKVFEKGITKSQDKNESLKRATTPYWKQIKKLLQSKHVRTFEQYFNTFQNV